MLLVEDNIVNQQVAQKCLERLGCFVHTVNDGLAGVNAFREERFDLILMEYFDHLENDMSAALSKIRTESRAPLMMLTDGQTTDWSVNALKAGADAIFNLNTPEDIILARCNALLRRWLPQP